MTTQHQTIKISDVRFRTRMRKDLGNLEGLMDSIARHGLIQPIVLDHDNFLIAGERRFRCHEELKKDEIRFIYHDQIPDDVKEELEFEENFWRKSFTWQEESLGILNIYRKKKLAAALEGWSQSYQKIIAEMFGMSVGNINYILTVAKRLEQEMALPEDKRKYWKFQSANEAYRLGLLAEETDRMNLELAARAKRAVNTQAQVAHVAAAIVEVDAAQAAPDLLAARRQQYESNPLNTLPFDTYWAEKVKVANEGKNTIYISNQFHHGDCIEYMMSPERKGVFNHIVTDIPYGINLDHLNQTNAHGGMIDVDRLEDQHDVVENFDLMRKFFPAAFHCTDERAFVITCCDIMAWQHMYDIAIAAGFRVQRWPYIWRKVNQSVMNNCSGYNTTKDFEPVMVCRKPSATVATKRNTSFTDASNVQATKDTGHPFAKPYELTKDLVEMISIPRQKILDPFAGGGSVVIQGLKMDRLMFGCEIEDHWFNQMMTNVKNLHYLKLNPNSIFK